MIILTKKIDYISKDYRICICVLWILIFRKIQMNSQIQSSLDFQTLTVMCNQSFR